MRHELAKTRNDWGGVAAMELRYRLFTALTAEATDALYWAQFHAARADFCHDHGAKYAGSLRVTAGWVRHCTAELAHELSDDWDQPNLG